jgi:hypothetical protein
MTHVTRRHWLVAYPSVSLLTLFLSGKGDQEDAAFASHMKELTSASYVITCEANPRIPFHDHYSFLEV